MKQREKLDIKEITFDVAIEKVLEMEGGAALSTDPRDQGNYRITETGAKILVGTRYGISARAYPKEDILNLTLKRAKELYYNDYWIAGHCHMMPPQLRLIHLDSCVNHGIFGAAKILQKACGGISVDGIIGRQTLSASKYLSVSAYAAQRLYYYLKIILKNPLQIRFARGWFKRVLEIQSYLGR